MHRTTTTLEEKTFTFVWSTSRLYGPSGVILNIKSMYTTVNSVFTWFFLSIYVCNIGIQANHFLGSNLNPLRNILPFFEDCKAFVGVFTEILFQNWYFVSKIIQILCEKNCFSDPKVFLHQVEQWEIMTIFET